jgi:hypothetical protein
MTSRQFLVAPVPGSQMIILISQLGSAACSKLFSLTKPPVEIVPHPLRETEKST